MFLYTLIEKFFSELLAMAFFGLCLMFALSWIRHKKPLDQIQGDALPLQFKKWQEERERHQTTPDSPENPLRTASPSPHADPSNPAPERIWRADKIPNSPYQPSPMLFGPNQTNLFRPVRIVARTFHDSPYRWQQLQNINREGMRLFQFKSGPYNELAHVPLLRAFDRELASICPKDGTTFAIKEIHVFLWVHIKDGSLTSSPNLGLLKALLWSSLSFWLICRDSIVGQFGMAELNIKESYCGGFSFILQGTKTIDHALNVHSGHRFLIEPRITADLTDLNEMEMQFQQKLFDFQLDLYVSGYTNEPIENA